MWSVQWKPLCPSVPRLSVPPRSVSGPVVAAEEADGSGLWTGLCESHDGGPEAPGPRSESGWSRWRGIPLPADPGASTATGGAAGPQQHTGEC